MDINEFETSLKELNDEISQIVACRAVYYASWPTEARLPIINRYKGFFFPVRDALSQAMLMSMARVVDTDKRTVSIPNLIGAIRDKPTLLPHASGDLLERLVTKSNEVAAVVKKLKAVRNQRLAHHDRNATPPTIVKSEMDQLIDQTVELFNDFSSALDRSVTSWHQITGDAEWHTELLLEEAELGIVARQKKIEDEIYGELDLKK
ncbi:MAG: hypothetical protein IH867_14175 [Chloroflexi bacterium]|nr:hypothetical protein [Chloroflexota bacterium]